MTCTNTGIPQRPAHHSPQPPAQPLPQQTSPSAGTATKFRRGRGEATNPRTKMNIIDEGDMVTSASFTPLRAVEDGIENAEKGDTFIFKFVVAKPLFEDDEATIVMIGSSAVSRALTRHIAVDGFRKEELRLYKGYDEMYDIDVDYANRKRSDQSARLMTCTPISPDGRGSCRGMYTRFIASTDTGLSVATHRVSRNEPSPSDDEGRPLPAKRCPAKAASRQEGLPVA